MSCCCKRSSREVTFCRIESISVFILFSLFLFSILRPEDDEAVRISFHVILQDFRLNHQERCNQK